MKKKYLLFLLVSIFITSLVFASGTTEKGTKDQSVQKNKEFIQIKSSAIGGSWYAGGGCMGKIDY